jgi:hypothetical protein
MSLACSFCQDTVLRQDCHRNRYGELVCRTCQASGVRFGWFNQLRYQMGKAGTLAWVLLGATALVLLLLWLFEVLLLLEPGKLLLG